MTTANDIMNHSGGIIDELTAGTTLNRIPAPLPIMQDYTNQDLQKLSPVDNLFPALVECFGIILLGYIAGR